jgi:hypothetical protein
MHHAIVGEPVDERIDVPGMNSDPTCLTSASASSAVRGLRSCSLRNG